MPLPVSFVGATIEPIVHEVDARWIMAHAASINAVDPCYLDTNRPTGVVAHPLFTACLEWPAMRAGRRLVPEDVLPFLEVVRGVHASHDLTVHRLVRPGDVLTTTATIRSIEQRPPGAYEVLHLVTIDEQGELVATTDMGTLFVGVDVAQGADRQADSDTAELTDVSTQQPAVNAEGNIAWADSTGASAFPVRSLGRVVEIPANAAHTYTEGSRIFNPIHTDPSVAEAAGLPGIILHGTATLAMAISEIIGAFADGDPDRIRRVRCRFVDMVMMPSRITVCVDAAPSEVSGEYHHRFEVLHPTGRPVLTHGSVTLSTSKR